MTKKLLKNVLIKLMREGFTDRVMYIDNVPEDLFYEMRHPRKIQILNNNPQSATWVADLEKEKVPTLKEHIKASLTGDKGLVFNIGNENARILYAAVERYVKTMDPLNDKEPIVFSQDPSNSAAPALALSEVPRVVLPVLSPSEKSSDAGKATLNLDDMKAKLKAEIMSELADEKKAKASERMAKARAARTLKK